MSVCAPILAPLPASSALIFFLLFIHILYHNFLNLSNWPLWFQIHMSNPILLFAVVKKKLKNEYLFQKSKTRANLRKSPSTSTAESAHMRGLDFQRVSAFEVVAGDRRVVHMQSTLHSGIEHMGLGPTFASKKSPYGGGKGVVRHCAFVLAPTNIRSILGTNVRRQPSTFLHKNF